MAIWLKLVGAVDDPMPPNWLSATVLKQEVGFTKKAAVDIHEELVFYAIPQGKIIAIAEVMSHPIWNGTKEPRWPWRSKIKLKLAIADYHRAPELADIQEPGGRDLKKSVQRQSHIKLRWGEYSLARSALEHTVDLDQGDLRAESVIKEA